MKTVLKWNPYLKFEIAAQEQWLEEMAHDGLFFHSRLGYLTWFQTGNPAPFRRFRLEPVREGDPLSGPSPDMAELFWQAGWRYEGFYCQSLYYLFFTDDPEAPEPYTDPQSKALALEDLVGQFRREFWMSLAGMVFFLFYDLVLEPKVYSVSFTPLLLSLELLALFLLAAALLFKRRLWREARRTQRRLEDGDGAPPPPARGLSAWKLALDGSTGVLILICLAMLIPQLIG